MTKNLGLSLFLALTLILGLTTGALASTDWHITWNDDGTILEEVFTDDQEELALLSNWGFSQGESEGSYYRKIEDWESFNNLVGKLPIVVNTSNWLILYNTSIALDYSTEFFTNVADKDFNLLLTVPGFYYGNSGEKVADMTSQWKVYPGWEKSLKKSYLTKCITFNGFYLGLFIIIVGLISIGGVYIRSISRVNHLIEEEYSIENYLASLNEEETDEETDEE